MQNMSRSSSFQQHQDNNDNLEEDMRKAKESADMLRSLVLPLETEINTLKNDLDFSKKRVIELENLVYKDKISTILTSDDDRLLRDDIFCCFNKFINSEINHIDVINQILSIVDDKQREQLISRNTSSNDTDKLNDFDHFLASINNVTVPQTHIDEIILKLDNLLKFHDENRNAALELQQIKLNYETEKKYREELEKVLIDKADIPTKNIEVLNREMADLEVIINELRSQYSQWHGQSQMQIDGLVKTNEEIRQESEAFRKENKRLKVENEGYLARKLLLIQKIDEELHAPLNLDEANQIINELKDGIIRLKLENQNLNEKIHSASVTIQELRQVTSSVNFQDQMVISQSLESELERLNKVLNDKETDNKQLRAIQHKLKTKLESMQKRLEQNEADIEKLKHENLELVNQMQVLKKEMRNNHSVQEDLVKLNQSLQIELEQVRASEKEVRCQHEDDYDECVRCNGIFSVTKRKHRCRHCCKIFCADCCSKSVNSGPNNRAHKVCDTCFLILDKTEKNSTSNRSSTNTTPEK